MNLEDKSQAILLGMACGDALGAPLEGYDVLQIKAMSGPVTDIREPFDLQSRILAARSEREINHLQRKIKTLRMPGLYTDDTQQALLVSEMLTLHKAVHLKALAQSYVTLASPHRDGELGLFRGAGPGFSTVIRNLRQQLPVHLCGVTSAGNGAAMRIAPIGIFYYNDMDLLLEATVEVSSLTHRDIRGICAAGMIAYCIAWLIPRKTFDSNDLLQDLYPFVLEMENRVSANQEKFVASEEIKHQVSNAISHLPSILEMEEPASIIALDRLASMYAQDEKINHGSPFALGSVIYSLYLFLRHGQDFETAVILAVNSGGDTDTIGAITAALCAALSGSQGIPKRWTDAIPTRTEISLRARTMVNPNLDLTSVRSLFQMEKDLCQAEDAYRAVFINSFKKRFVL